MAIRPFSVLLLLLFVVFPAALPAGAVKPIVIGQKFASQEKQSMVSAPVGSPFPDEKIHKKWGDGFFITSAAYSSRGWNIILNQTSRWTNQAYKLSRQWPNEWIQERKSEGYFVTSVASDGESWLVVLSQGTDYKQQWEGTETLSTITGYVRQCYELGYTVTSMAAKEGYWTFIMSVGESAKCEQKLLSSSSFSSMVEQVQSWHDEGYILTALDEDNGTYVYVVSRYKNKVAVPQDVFRVNDDIKDVIRNFWNSGYSVTITD